MELFAFLALLLIGFLTGRHLEAKHYRSIRKREEAFLHIPTITTKTLHGNRPVRDAQLASGNVVVSVDYYKRFLAALRTTFGGELGAYASLIDRARREATLRMKASCPGAHLFLNFRFETASISKGENETVDSVEVLAYATAITFADEVRSQAAG